MAAQSIGELGKAVQPRFEQFIKERRYLKNVSPRTIQWYEESFNWLKRYPLTEDGIKEFVVGMREAGLKATSCNSRIRVANAYFKWAGMPLHVGRMREPGEVLPVFGEEALQKLISFKPRKWHEKRLLAIVCTLLDCGLRIEECLAVRRVDVDFDNLLLKVKGKGDKERVVPFSCELRKRLYHWCGQHEFGLVFPTRHGTRLGRRDVLRDLKALCRRLGFEPPRRTIHALRHTFALNYIRKGGGEFRLQKMLGHTSLAMTRKYVNLATSDLQEKHEQVSLLGRR
jgi:integrase/recombinase XerD